jgi:hypothetical protein
MRLRLALCVSLLALCSAVVMPQDTFSNEVLRLINEARSAVGAAPLYDNARLAQAAQAHSDDMAAAGILTHVGSDGSQFWERASRSGYTMTNGAQNVLARADLSAVNVVEQWNQSEANRANLLNTAYQEAGFGYARSSAGTYYFTLLLGARLNFIPPTPLASPTVAVLVAPTATPSAQASQTAAPVVPTTDPLVQTLIAPLPTATTRVMLPSRTPDPAAPTQQGFVVPTAAFRPDVRLFITPETVTLQNVSQAPIDLSLLRFESSNATFDAARWDIEFLTAPLTAFPVGDCLQVWGLGTADVLPAAEACDNRHGWVLVGDTQAFWKNIDQFRVLNGGVVVGYCAASAAATVVCDITFSAPQNGGVFVPPFASPTTAFGSAGVVRLLIEPESVTLLNLTGADLDVSGWVFDSPDGQFEAASWQLAELSRPLTALPTGDCLQVWQPGYNLLPKPPACRYRHGWVSVGAARQFWRSASFTVRSSGQTLGTCATTTAVCDIRP